MRWIGLVSGLLGSAIADQAQNGPEPVPDPATAESPNPEIPGSDGKIPTPEQLLQVLDSMTGLSEEEKAKLKEDLLRNVQERASAAYDTLAGNDLTTQTIVLLSLLAIVALIFVFFVYKLFKCLSEREQKREEKKRNKLSKKKK